MSVKPWLATVCGGAMGLLIATAGQLLWHPDLVAASAPLAQGGLSAPLEEAVPVEPALGAAASAAVYGELSRVETRLTGRIEALEERLKVLEHGDATGSEPEADSHGRALDP